MRNVDKVITVREAADLANVSPWTIRYHVDKGHLVYRKSGHVTLICLQSVLNLYQDYKIIGTKTHQNPVG